MVGDGLNDAAALAGASIGVAVGCGTQVTMESAQVILLSSRWENQRETMKINEKSLKNNRKVIENARFSLFFIVSCRFRPRLSDLVSFLDLAESTMPPGQKDHEVVKIHDQIHGKHAKKSVKDMENTPKTSIKTRKSMKNTESIKS